MIASLPMYDRPETAAANDRLWNGVRAALGYGPEALSRGGNLTSLWQSPDLLLSQTCSLPFRVGLVDHVDIVATPVHDLPCPPGTYFSVLVVRQDDPRTTKEAFRGAPLAINEATSQSGWAAVTAVTRNVQEVTGSHAASAHAVATGLADIAAIDAVTWRMILRWDDVASALRVLGQTAPTPALPFITRKSRDITDLRTALSQAIAALTPEDRDTLCLTGITEVPVEAYLALPLPPGACKPGANP